jgi:hypothetical protein
MTEPTATLPSANALGPETPSSSTESHDLTTDHPVETTLESALLGALASPQADDIDEDNQSGEVKLTLLLSAELATRAANLAAKAGTSLHQETQNLVANYKIQRRYGLMMLIAFGTLVLISCSLFGWLSIRMQSRIVQLDAMLLAVGKRVVAMDESLEAVSATGDTLRDMSAKQDAISNQQARSDVRMEDLLTAIGKTEPGKTSEPKSADILKILQGIDSRLQVQTNLVKGITSHVPSAPRPVLDASVVRREVEAALRQQRQLLEAVAKANPPPASPSAAVPVTPALAAKPRERLVQYPRSQAQGSTTETQ